MRLDPLSPGLASLLERPSPATLTLYRANGEAVTSPVWFRLEGEALEVVIAAAGPKLEAAARAWDLADRLP